MEFVVGVVVLLAQLFLGILLGLFLVGHPEVGCNIHRQWGKEDHLDPDQDRYRD